MRLLVIPILLTALSCAPNIHPAADQTEYTLNYSRYICNDSLRLYFKSPADIFYPQASKSLKKALRKSELKAENGIVLYGISEYPPYEYVLTVGSDHLSTVKESHIVFDTIIGDQTVRFVGNPLVNESKRSLSGDLESMFRSLSQQSLDIE